MDATQTKILTDIEKYGWHVCYIPGDRSNPGWAFTIGLYRTFGHPEFVIFGLSSATMHQVMINLVENIRSGARYESGREYSEIFREGKCTFQPVAKCWYPDFLGYGTWFYESADFPILQIVWPENTKKSMSKSEPRPTPRILQPLLFYEDAEQARAAAILDMISKAHHTHSSEPANATISTRKANENLPVRHHKFKPEEWPFQAPEDTKAYTTLDIVNKKHPILGVVHDDDGTWQILSGKVVEPSEVRRACLGCVFEFDRSVGELADLPPGWEAWREDPNKPWQRNYVESDENR